MSDGELGDRYWPHLKCVSVCGQSVQARLLQFYHLARKSNNPEVKELASWLGARWELGCEWSR